MAFSATVRQVMIASPGDVHGERAIVREVLQEWNAVNAEHRRTVLLALGWETNVAPEMGDEPQSIINKQILHDADLLVGIFWTRIGTATHNYASGSVEEIEEHVATGKPAMLYFSSAPVMLESVDPDQYKALKVFKNACMKRGVYETYTNLADFRQKFSRQLALLLNDDAFQSPLAAGHEPAASNADVPLSREATMLLQAASKDAGGQIIRVAHGMGVTVQSNDQTFTENGDARTIALWDGALEELVQATLVKSVGTQGEVFEVTRMGYEAADRIAP